MEHEKLGAVSGGQYGPISKPDVAGPAGCAAKAGQGALDYSISKTGNLDKVALLIKNKTKKFGFQDGGEMIGKDSSDCQIIMDSLNGRRAIDEQTFTSLAVLSERLERLKRGLRLMAKRRQPLQPGERVATLRQARPGVKDPNWYTLHRATARQLDEGAGLGVSRVLKGLGAAVGTQEDLLGDQERMRRCFCVVFPEDDEFITVCAYVLTRVLPIRNEYAG